MHKGWERRKGSAAKRIALACSLLLVFLAIAERNGFFGRQIKTRLLSANLWDPQDDAHYQAQQREHTAEEELKQAQAQVLVERRSILKKNALLRWKERQQRHADVRKFEQALILRHAKRKAARGGTAESKTLPQVQPVEHSVKGASEVRLVRLLTERAERDEKAIATLSNAVLELRATDTRLAQKAAAMARKKGYILTSTNEIRRKPAVLVKK